MVRLCPNNLFAFIKKEISIEAYLLVVEKNVNHQCPLSDVKRERLNILAPLIYIQNNGIRGSYNKGFFPEMALLQGSRFPLPCIMKIVPLNLLDDHE